MFVCSSVFNRAVMRSLHAPVNLAVEVGSCGCERASATGITNFSFSLGVNICSFVCLFTVDYAAALKLVTDGTRNVCLSGPLRLPMVSLVFRMFTTRYSYFELSNWPNILKS